MFYLELDLVTALPTSGFKMRQSIAGFDILLLMRENSKFFQYYCQFWKGIWIWFDHFLCSFKTSNFFNISDFNYLYYIPVEPIWPRSWHSGRHRTLSDNVHTYWSVCHCPMFAAGLQSVTIAYYFKSTFPSSTKLVSFTFRLAYFSFQHLTLFFSFPLTIF